MRAIAEEGAAQGTVEYALTVFAMLALIMGIAALWRAAEQGLFVDAAANAASHGLEGDGYADIALY